MKFLIDECTGPEVASWLKAEGHDVFSVFHSARGLDDVAIIEKAFSENRILITNDKGFGELVYQKRQPHHGVVLLRLVDERPAAKIAVIDDLIKGYSGLMADHYLVVTSRGVRSIKE